MDNEPLKILVHPRIKFIQIEEANRVIKIRFTNTSKQFHSEGDFGKEQVRHIRRNKSHNPHAIGIHFELMNNNGLTLLNQIKRREKQERYITKKKTPSSQKTFRNEVEFISYLSEMFQKLKYSNVTVLHRSSRPEHGKDIVFYERTKLDHLTFYAVVATNQEIHSDSSKTSDSAFEGTDFSWFIIEANFVNIFEYESDNPATAGISMKTATIGSVSTLRLPFVAIRQILRISSSQGFWFDASVFESSNANAFKPL